MIHVTPANVTEVRVPADAVVMRPLVTQEAHGDDVSLTWVRLAGRHRRLRTDRSTRVYYVLDGRARFTVGDEDACEVRGGEVVVVPRGVAYEFEGEITYLVVNGPAFLDGDDVYE